MKFQEVYKPIQKELTQVEKELKSLSLNISYNSLHEILEYFFKIPGKYLRPTLVLLSAGSVNPKLSRSFNFSLIQLSVAVELIHSASLIHDDIIDGDLFRRGQKTLNNIYGKKIAVLAGDVLYAHAFSIINESLPKSFLQNIIQLTTDMCAAEVNQAKQSKPNKEMYLNIIKGKTASFMSLCCKLGTELLGGSEEEVLALKEYGLNLGITYQIIDDYIDNDINVINNVTLEDAYYYAQKAEDAIRNFEDSPYKESLINMVNYVLTFPNNKVNNA